MNGKQEDVLRKLCIGILLPMLLVGVAVLLLPAQQASPLQPQQTHTADAPAQGYELCVLIDGERRTMLLDDYLQGVVLGEMPASFEMDALRAQAVAARTYTLKKCLTGDRHGSNTLCTQPDCCQAYTDMAQYLADGGSTAAVLQAAQAVHDTAGQVLMYDGALIMATYFSCAGDATESAVAVWGQEYPYLQSVPSPGEEDALFYTDSVSFSAEEFQKALGIRLEGSVEQWFGEVRRTSGGGVESMLICEIPYRGTTLRSLLGLRSTDFTVSVQNGSINIVTRGYGHRVGMSQYGANAMAKSGKSYREILLYYYTGAELVQYNDE